MTSILVIQLKFSKGYVIYPRTGADRFPKLLKKGWPAMDTLIKDIRYSIRSLTKRPGFTAIAVITLALGIGASTAIFSVVDGVLLRPLPYPNAEQIVQLREVGQRGGKIPFTEPNYLDVRARSHSFQGLAQYNGELATVTGGQ